MGKVTRDRKKYHTPGKSKQVGTSVGEIALPAEDFGVGTFGLPTSNVPLNFPLPDNIFSGVNISRDILKQELDVHSVLDDTGSVISKKSFKSDRPYKKKEKRQLRHEVFLMKLNAAKEAELEVRKRKKRQKTVITGDMQPLADALPEFAAHVPEKLRPTKQRSTPKAKQRQQAMLEDIAWLKKAMEKQTSNSK